MEATDGVGPPASTYSHADPTASSTDRADGQPVDNTVLQQHQHRDIHVQQQDLNSGLSSTVSGQQPADEQQQHCSIVWMTSDQSQSSAGPLPPVSEVVNSHRSSRASMHLGGNGMASQDSLQSYLTCSLPDDAAGHSATTLELMSAVTSMDRIQMSSDPSGSSNIYSIAPSSVAGGHALTSDTSIHHIEKPSHYHPDNLVHHLGLDLGHQPSPPPSSQPGSSLPNFAEVSAGRVDSVTSTLPPEVREQPYYDDHSMVSDVATLPKDLEEFVETLSCYKCKLCTYISLSRDGVDQHVRATHSKIVLPEPEEKPLPKSIPEVEPEKPPLEPTVTLSQKYICGICAKAYADIESCSVHMNYAHNLSADSVHLEPADGHQHLHLLQQQERPEFTGIVSAEAHQGECDMAEITIQQTDHQVAGDGGQSQLSATKSKVATKKRKRRKSDIEGNGLSKGPVTLDTTKFDEDDVSKLAMTSVSIGNKITEVVIDNGQVGDEPQTKLVSESPRATKKRSNSKRSAAKNVLPGGNHALSDGTKGDTSSEMDDTSTGQRCEATGCSVWLRSLENLEYHRKCHADEGFECVECMEHFDRWKTLCVHLWREHLIDMELYACDLCSYKTYSYSKLMNLHRRIHSDERPYLCDVCGKGFKTSKQLRNHKVIHLERKPQRNLRSGECDVCHRYFSDKRMLRVHKDTVHNKLRPYVCNYCGYAASCRSTLKMHVRQHTGEKPFACDVCEYRTADHNSLRRHKMRHSGEKPYKCPFCTYACIQSSTYKAHLKNKHPGMDAGLMFCCDQCPFKTIKKENFVAHMADHASKGSATMVAPLAVVAPMAVPPLPPQTRKQPRTLATTQMLPVQVVLASEADVENEIEEKLQRQEADAGHVDTSVTNRDHFLYTELNDEHHENIHLQVYKLESGETEERFPILASQLKRSDTPPLSSSSGDPPESLTFDEQRTVLVHQQPLSTEERSDPTDDSIVLSHAVHFVHHGENEEVGNVAVTAAAAAMVHLHQMEAVGELTAANCDDDDDHGSSQVDSRKHDEPAAEIISHAQLTPVPPSEISTENGPMLW